MEAKKRNREGAMKGENIGVPLERTVRNLLLGSMKNCEQIMEIYSHIYLQLVEEDCKNLVKDFSV